MKIMEEVSKIFKIYITRQTIDREVRVLETTGKFDDRKEHDLLVLILKYLHDNETYTPIKSA